MKRSEIKKRNWNIAVLVFDKGYGLEAAGIQCGLSRAMGPKIVKPFIKAYFFLSEWDQMDNEGIVLNDRIEMIRRHRKKAYLTHL